MSRSYKKQRFYRMVGMNHSKTKKDFNKKFRHKMNKGDFDDSLDTLNSHSFFKKMMEDASINDHRWKEFVTEKEYQSLDKEMKDIIDKCLRK